MVVNPIIPRNISELKIYIRPRKPVNMEGACYNVNLQNGINGSILLHNLFSCCNPNKDIDNIRETTNIGPEKLSW